MSDELTRSDLLGLSREDLEVAAAAAGVDDPAGHPNKEALADAVLAARAGTAAATAPDPEPAEPPQLYDVVGADGRRITRGLGKREAEQERDRISGKTGEKIKVESASMPALGPVRGPETATGRTAADEDAT